MRLQNILRFNWWHSKIVKSRIFSSLHGLTPFLLNLSPSALYQFPIKWNMIYWWWRKTELWTNTQGRNRQNATTSPEFAPSYPSFIPLFNDMDVSYRGHKFKQIPCTALSIGERGVSTTHDDLSDGCIHKSPNWNCDGAFLVINHKQQFRKSHDVSLELLLPSSREYTSRAPPQLSLCKRHFYFWTV